MFSLYSPSTIDVDIFIESILPSNDFVISKFLKSSLGISKLSIETPLS